MTIDSIRKAMSNKGCQIAMIVIGALLAVGMIWPLISTALYKGTSGEDGAGAPVVAKVGDQTVTSKQISDALDQALAQQSTNPFSMTGPLEKFTKLQEVVASSIDSLLLKKLVAKEGVSVTDEDIKKVLNEQLETKISDTRRQMVATNKLKSTATDEEFAKAFKEFSGTQQTPDELRASASKRIDEILKSPAEREAVEAGLMAQLLLDHYEKTIKVSDEDVKAGFETFTFAQIPFSDTTKSVAERTELAEKAKAEVEGGKSIVDVRKAYTGKADAETIEYSKALIDATPLLEDLDDLKPGEVSDVITLGGSPTVLQLKSVAVKLPDNYEKDKASLMKMEASARAFKKLESELKKAREDAKIEWADQFLKLVYEMGLEMRETAGQPDEIKETADDLLSQLRSTDVSTTTFPNYVPVMEYQLLEQLYQTASADEAEQYQDERLNAALTVLESDESPMFRLTIIGEMFKAGRKEDGFNLLLQAASLNSDTEIMGEILNAQITQVADAAIQAKNITPEQRAEIQKELDRWAKDKAEALAMQKEMEKQQAEIDKELDKDVVPDSGSASKEPATSSGASGE